MRRKARASNLVPRVLEGNNGGKLVNSRVIGLFLIARFHNRSQCEDMRSKLVVTFLSTINCKTIERNCKEYLALQFAWLENSF